MDKDRQSLDFPQIPTCGDFDIRIAGDGTWYYRNSAIGRLSLVKLFSRVLHRGEDGTYWLITPAERGKVDVEDVPFLIVEMKVEGGGKSRQLHFRTNVEDWVTAGPHHPLYLRNNIPYINIRDRLEAKINRSVYYDLVSLAEKDGKEEPSTNTLFVWSGGQKFSLGNIDATE